LTRLDWVRDVALTRPSTAGLAAIPIASGLALCGSGVAAGRTGLWGRVALAGTFHDGAGIAPVGGKGPVAVDPVLLHITHAIGPYEMGASVGGGAFPTASGVRCLR